MKIKKKWICLFMAGIICMEAGIGDAQAVSGKEMERKGSESGTQIVYAAKYTDAPSEKWPQKNISAAGVESTDMPKETAVPTGSAVAVTMTPEISAAAPTAVASPDITSSPASTQPTTPAPVTQSPTSPKPTMPAPATQSPASPEPTTPAPTKKPDQKPGRAGKLYFCGRGRHRVKIGWKKAEKTNYYRIYRKIKQKKKYQLVGKTKQNYYLDKRLTAEKKYSYKVIAVNTAAGIKTGKARIGNYNNITIVHTKHQKYSYKELSGDVKELEKKYHGIVRCRVIGKSEDNRNIYDIVIGNPKAKKTMLVVANLHAREYMTSQLCMDQIEYYLENYYKSQTGGAWGKTLDKIAVHYIPMANPDGTTISQYGIGAIKNADLRRKLRKMKNGSTTTWKANARGVDLNRNYPVRFRKQGSRGSQGYSGKKACSESETRAIKRLTDHLAANSNLQAVVNYHAMGSIIFGGSGLGGRLQKNTDRLYHHVKKITGYASSAGYKSSSGGDGNYLTYIQRVRKTPGVTLEIGRRSCPGPAWEYPSIWAKNKTVVIRAARLFQ